MQTTGNDLHMQTCINYGGHIMEYYVAVKKKIKKHNYTKWQSVFQSISLSKVSSCKQDANKHTYKCKAG